MNTAKIAIAQTHIGLAITALDHSDSAPLARNALRVVLEHLDVVAAAATKRATVETSATKKITPKAKTPTLTVQGKDGLTCEVVTKESIRLVGTLQNTCKADPRVDRTYRIGDKAIYGGFNLTYIGRIVSIGAKTVTIQERDCGSCRKHRLTHERFCRWNRDSVGEAQRRNSEWYD